MENSLDFKCPNCGQEMKKVCIPTAGNIRWTENKKLPNQESFTSHKG